MRFKIATSFLIAALGVVMLVRLAAIAPLAPSTALSFIAPLVLVAAGIWRGVIFLRAAKAQPSS